MRTSFIHLSDESEISFIYIAIECREKGMIKYHEDLFFIRCCCLRFAEHAFFFAVILQSRVAMAEEGLLLQQERAISKPKRLSCIPKVDALWFCYSPVYQMTEYYRDGTFDNCRSKWTELFDCISLKAKPADQVQAILEERERKKPHIWEFRTPEEASKHWKEEFGHLQD